MKIDFEKILAQNVTKCLTCSIKRNEVFGTLKELCINTGEMFNAIEEWAIGYPMMKK